jgi:hypothetical protein
MFRMGDYLWVYRAILDHVNPPNFVELPVTLEVDSDKPKECFQLIISRSPDHSPAAVVARLKERIADLEKSNLDLVDALAKKTRRLSSD